MLESLTAENFQPLVGQSFRVRFAEFEVAELALVEASAIGADTDPQRTRTPFRLLFRGTPGRVAQQAIYLIEHETLGEQGIFLVPVSADADGVYYEAIFN